MTAALKYSYGTNLAVLDFYLFEYFKKRLRGKRFAPDKSLKEAVE